MPGEEATTPTPALEEARRDQRLGRAMRAIGNYLLTQPALLVALLLAVLLGRHEAMRVLGFEAEPAAVVSGLDPQASRQSARMAGAEAGRQAAEEALRPVMAALQGQSQELRDIHRDLLDLALHQSSLPPAGPRMASRP